MSEKKERHAKYMREWRKTTKGIACTDKHNESLIGSPASKAKSEVYKLVRKGILPKANTLLCIDCWGSAEVYDHRDYNKPMNVSPVCRSCNSLRGAAINAQ